MIDLKHLQTEVDKWQQRNFAPICPYQPLLGLQEEVGELAHAHLKQEQNIRGLWQEHQQAKKDAVGDILIYLAAYCAVNEVDLNSAAEETWLKVSQRDWKTDPKTGGKE